MPKYVMTPGQCVYLDNAMLKGDKRVVVVPQEDWRALVRYCELWMTAHHCEGHCAECDEDDSVRKAIARVEELNS